MIQTQSSSRKSHALQLAAALFASAIGLTGCTRKEPAKKAGPPPPVPVVVAEAREKDMPVQLRAIGNVMAYSTVTIRSQVTGQLAKLHIQEGQDVKAGDSLFTIDQRPFIGQVAHTRADLERDKSQLESARLDYERKLKLFASKVSSQDEIEKAEAAYKTLQSVVLGSGAAYSNALLNLDWTTIRSPISGRTGNLLAHEGNIAKAPDDALLSINQVQPIYVSFSVPEQFLPIIRRRMSETKLTVDVTFANQEGTPPRGELTFVDNSVNPNTGMIQLKATFPNTDNSLWPGQFVRASLTLSQRPRSVVVPSEAIQPGQNGDFVFVVKADQSVEVRRVKPGTVDGGVTVVDEGLQAGETVVVDGQLRLMPGAKINAKPAVIEKPAQIAKEEAKP
ncbi:MAG: efflux RND transporter periplasmic adaptor subunit [Proteobacteria bacterium]|nr:efflux RND transporter periplasmic adaptor subunit [Pseudomonadota bacterium]